MRWIRYIHKSCIFIYLQFVCMYMFLYMYIYIYITHFGEKIAGHIQTKEQFLFCNIHYEMKGWSFTNSKRLFFNLFQVLCGIITYITWRMSYIFEKLLETKILEGFGKFSYEICHFILKYLLWYKNTIYPLKKHKLAIDIE